MKEWAVQKILSYFKFARIYQYFQLNVIFQIRFWILLFQNVAKHVFSRLKQSSMLLIVLSVVFLIVELIIPSIYTELVGGRYDGRNLAHVFFYIACTLVFFLAGPLFLNQFFYREKLKDLGFVRPKNPIETSMLMLLALGVIVPAIIYLAKMPSFQSYYSLNRPSHAKLAFIILTIFPIYYFCEEFFFRGFLFMNLWRRMRWNSFWVTDILFTLAHIGKPFLEIMIALPVGIILALLTLRTKSIYPSMIVHYVLGIVMLLVVNQVI